MSEVWDAFYCLRLIKQWNCNELRCAAW